MNPYSVLFFFSIIALLANPYATQAQPQPQPQRHLHRIPLPFGVVGAEDIAFDCNGQGPYVGVADGRILKWNGRHAGWTVFATTSRFRYLRPCDGSRDRNNEPICGRPLGLKFNLTSCELYIADAYFGLMKTPPTGGLAQTLATSAAGIPFRFLNGVDINPETGMVYLTDTSTVYQRRSWESVFGTQDKTGRLLQYDPATGRVTVLMDRIGFANGVSLSRDNSFLLVGEGKTSTIFKYWLRGPKAHQHEVFAHLPAAPDNIKRNQNGEFWAAIHDYRGQVGLKLNEQGTIIESLSEPGLTAISDVDEHNGAIWTGSVRNPYVGVSF